MENLNAPTKILRFFDSLKSDFDKIFEKTVEETLNKCLLNKDRNIGYYGLSTALYKELSEKIRLKLCENLFIQIDKNLQFPDKDERIVNLENENKSLIEKNISILKSFEILYRQNNKNFDKIKKMRFKNVPISEWDDSDYCSESE